MNASAPSPQVPALLQEARQTLRSGNVAGAMRLWEQVRQREPDNPEALVQLAQAHLVQRRPEQARELLVRAVAAHPRLSVAHAYMARVQRQEGDAEGALRSLDLAIRHEPGAWGALMEKGELLDSLDRHREAALSWSTALQSMPPEAAGLPHMQAAIDKARKAVDADRARLREHLESRTGELRQGERPRDVERYEHALDIVTGRRPFVTARPVGLAIPRLPAIMFFDREDFPWAREVEAATADIVEELRTVSERDADGFEPYVQTRPGESAAQFSGLDSNPDWSAYFLWKHGRRMDAHCELCPRTVAAVQHAPMVHVRSRAPAVLFSRLEPGVRIPPHNGATNSRLTVHLPLVIPDNCAIRVGDEVRQWRMGELLLFDDTIQHEAWNLSGEQRTVLIFDVWHPMLSMLERELVTRTVEGMVDYYSGAQELGEL